MVIARILRIWYFCGSLILTIVQDNRICSYNLVSMSLVAFGELVTSDG